MTSTDLQKLASSFAGRETPQEVIAAVLPQARVLAVAGVREHFQRSEAPDGKKWRALQHGRVGGGTRPLEDTGRLKASVSAEVKGGGVFLTASHPGASVHQYGATIRPKRAKMLALPVTREAKRVGSPRQNHFPRPLFVHASGDGAAVLAEGNGDGTITVHYVLRREVRIPARPFLGFSAKTQAKIDRLVSDRVAAYLAQMFGDRPVFTTR